MALAPVAYTIWHHFLRYDPDDPIWPNRDRFVLSNGHASMLLYAMLHLAASRPSMRNTSVWASRPSRSTTSSAFASSAANVPATRNIT